MISKFNLEVKAMGFWLYLIKLLQTGFVSAPTPYGLFHIISLILTITFTAMVCVYHRKDSPDKVRKTVLWVSLAVVGLEILKQILFTVNFSESGEPSFSYAWYAFPFQFCSTPMYVGVLQGIIKKGKIHDSLCAYLATYAVFAGLCVMLYPGDVFMSMIFICVQTMFCHGSMIPVGAYLMSTGHVKTEHKTIFKAMCTFGVAVVVAILLNELVYASGILGGETFNMFFISRYFPSTLPVYSSIHNSVPYPLNVIIYFAGFSLAAYIILLIAMGIKKIAKRLSKEKVEN